MQVLKPGEGVFVSTACLESRARCMWQGSVEGQEGLFSLQEARHSVFIKIPPAHAGTDRTFRNSTFISTYLRRSLFLL